jgi:hypothetical protein
MKKTCDKCRHYAAEKDSEGFGTCALMGDSNEFHRAGGYAFMNGRAYGWDYEGYSAGVYVTPKFGCINWEKGIKS